MRTGPRHATLALQMVERRVMRERPGAATAGVPGARVAGSGRAGPHATVLDLQRRAGNAATAHVVARQSATKVRPKAKAKGSGPALPFDAKQLEKQWADTQKALTKAAQDQALEHFRAKGRGKEADVKAEAIAHAYEMSWVITGKFNAKAAARSLDETWAEITGDKTHKRPRVQSVLSGAYLRMYLDAKSDPDLIEAAGVEIAASPEFARYRSELEAHLARHPPDPAGGKAEEQLETAAQAYFDWRRKSKAGMAFRYELNPVIGGVGGADVVAATYTTTDTDKGVRLDYRIEVAIKDVYDFKNKREGAYEKYRVKLATLLRDGKYEEFWEAYGREALGVGRKTSLDDAAVFASFMYAIEDKGWTPGGLAWSATVPMTGSLTLPKAKPKGR